MVDLNDYKPFYYNTFTRALTSPIVFILLTRMNDFGECEKCGLVANIKMSCLFSCISHSTLQGFESGFCWRLIGTLRERVAPLFLFTVFANED